MATAYSNFFTPKSLDWRKRLEFIIDTMREMSRQTDPQVIGKTYSARMRELLPIDRFVALSRRDLDPPAYRITRSSRWKEEINPWKESDRLPLFATRAARRADLRRRRRGSSTTWRSVPTTRRSSTSPACGRWSPSRTTTGARP